MLVAKAASRLMRLMYAYKHKTEIIKYYYYYNVQLCSSLKQCFTSVELYSSSKKGSKAMGNTYPPKQREPTKYMRVLASFQVTSCKY